MNLLIYPDNLLFPGECKLGKILFVSLHISAKSEFRLVRQKETTEVHHLSSAEVLSMYLCSVCMSLWSHNCKNLGSAWAFGLCSETEVSRYMCLCVVAPG